MDSSFGALDAFAFLVFAVLIFVGVIIVVNLGKLPGQLVFNRNNPSTGLGLAGTGGNACAGVHAPDVVGNIRVDQALGSVPGS